MKYVAVVLLFFAAILAIEELKPRQIAHLEDGVFLNRSTGATLVIADDMVSYQGHTQRFDVWIGKGKRFLSTKGIVGNLFSVEAASGKRVPAELVSTNEANSRTVCSVENGRDTICFDRVR